MIEELKKLWAQTPWYLKILLLVLVPLVLLDNGRGFILKLLGDAANRDTDQKAEKLREDGKKLAHEAAESEGRLEELRKERERAGEEAQNDDAVDFYNKPRKDDQ
jgi:hypothetical protein